MGLFGGKYGIFRSGCFAYVRACMYVCVVVNVADCKKMKKVCKIVAVGVYIIAEWRK